MKLSEYRKKHDKTQRQCALELDITVQYFGDIERGAVKCGRKMADRLIEWSGGEITYHDLWASLCLS